MNKLAIPWSTIAKAIGVPAVAAGGALLGYKVMPRLSGYEDIESSKRQSAVINAGTALGLYLTMLSKGMLGSGGLTAIKQFFTKYPKAVPIGSATIIAEELLPSITAAMSRSSNAVMDQAAATREQARALTAEAQKSSIPQAVSDALSSSTAKGMGLGTGVAGMAGIATGLVRRKSDKEEQEKRTRSQMIGSDVVKFLIPAIVAGGVIGSLRQK